MRNFLATLLLSQGCPMLSHGDELGRTQRGNNNAYCQDNELSWVDWENADEQLIDWTARLITLRREQPVLHRQKFFVGAVGRGHRRQDLVWLRPDGLEMRDSNWRNRSLLSIGMLLNGEMIPDRSERGEPTRGDTLLILLHSHYQPLGWKLPDELWGRDWEIVVDTARPCDKAGERRCRAGTVLAMEPRSMVVLRRIG
jgi:glycogen operon protein